MSAANWTELGQAVRAARRRLGIPTQAAAAARADVSLNTWQRLESGAQVGNATLTAAAAVLGWEPGTPQTILSGARPPEAAAAPVSLPPGPALVYLTTDGARVQLDRADLTALNARERALCRALLDHAREQLDQADAAARLPLLPVGPPNNTPEPR